MSASARGWLASTVVAFACIAAPPRFAAAAPVGRVTIVVPGAKADIVLPAGFCPYPETVLAQARGTMTGMHVLGAAGDCTDIETLSSRQPAPSVRRSMVFAVLDRDFDAATRSTPTGFLRDCLDNFPRKGDAAVAAEIERAGKTEGGPTLGGAQPLGLLRATRNAIFGGDLITATRPGVSVLQVQVTACFSPGGVPLLWLSQENVSSASSPAAISEALDATLRGLVEQVAATMAAN